MKKIGKLRVCIDFRDLNNATLKDEYPMPIVMLIDLAAGHETLSFMDGYSCYSQIYIAMDGWMDTAFKCPSALGTYDWVVMPFGLKNVSTIYQSVMNKVFHDFIGKFMEIYIDDVVAKSNAKDKHLRNLKQAFDRIRKHKLKMNILKCAFGVIVGNFLVFLVQKKGIEVDKNKTKAILEASPPTSKKQFQAFL